VSDWHRTTLGDVLNEPPRNGIHKGVAWQGQGTPVIKMGEVYSSDYVADAPRDRLDLTESEVERLAVRDGDLLFCRTSLVADGVGRCGLVRHLNERSVFASNLIRVRVDGTKADPRFIHWLFRSPMGQNLRRSIARGTSVTTITGPDLASLQFPLPPIVEQRAIAGVLGALDDKIESNRRAADLLEKLIEAEYRDATTGAPDSPYSTVLAVQMGAPFSGDQFSEPGVGRPLIRIRDLKTFAPQVWTTESRPDEISVCRGDVLVGMDAEFRSMLWLGADGVLNQRMCRFVPRSNVGTAFAWFSIRADLEFCERAKSGTTVIHLNKSDVERFRVPHLSEEAHHVFYLKTQPMVDRLASLGLESQLLADLRDALLPELLSGRLRVREAEEMVGSV
jgi:type I restriction enzyme S subunit